MILIFSNTVFASASEDVANSSEGMIFLLALIGIVLAAYLLTHFVVERLQKRYLFVSGVEYLLLGMALSSFVLFQNQEAIMPVLVMSVGFFGILYGLDNPIKILLGTENSSLRLSLANFVFISTGTTLLFSQILPLMTDCSTDLAWYCGAALGCSAAASSAQSVDVIQERFDDVKTQMYDLLRQSIEFTNMMSALAFGVLLCVSHSLHSGSVDASASDLAWVTLVIGLGLGILFSLFLDRESDENSRFLAVTGITSLASGAAAFLMLSVLTVNYLLGLFLAYTKQVGDLKQALQSAERPMRLVLLVFAGMLWTQVDLVKGSVCLLLFLLSRWIFQAVACWIASMGTNLRFDVFRGLLAQGEISLCIAISFRLLFEGEVVDLIYSSMLFSVVLNELIAPRFLRSLLVDAGDLRLEWSSSMSQSNEEVQ
ncbi:MAG: hypothetical protein CMK59_01895 [Proteobacteria bacterium]|nr:hypothetical protein [Pseudomonadota bacterium]